MTTYRQEPCSQPAYPRRMSEDRYQPWCPIHGILGPVTDFGQAHNRVGEHARGVQCCEGWRGRGE